MVEKNEEEQKSKAATLGCRASTQKGRESGGRKGWSNVSTDQAGSIIGTKDFESRLCQEAVLYLVASRRFTGNGTIKCMLKNKNRTADGFGGKNKMRQISAEQKTDKISKGRRVGKKKDN